MKSNFTGRFWGYIGRYLLYIFLSVITLGIAIPFCTCRFLKWQKSNTYVDGYRFVFDGNGFQLWGRIILWMLLSLVTFGLYSLYIPVAFGKWITKHTHLAR